MCRDPRGIVHVVKMAGWHTVCGKQRIWRERVQHEWKVRRWKLIKNEPPTCLSCIGGMKYAF